MTTSQPLRATPKLYTDRLGRDLYSPAQALAQLVANSLDADAHTTRVVLEENELGVVHRVTIEDDGHGISPERFSRHFRDVGTHYDDLVETGRPRRVMGSKGIGRMAQFRLGYRSVWNSVSEVDGVYVRLSWAMAMEDLSPHDFSQHEVDDHVTGTRIEIDVHGVDDAQLHRFLNEQMVLRELFNAFASRLLQDDRAREVRVNDVVLNIEDYVDEQSMEALPGDPEIGRPDATLRHLVVTQRVRMEHAAAIFIAGDGWTYETVPLTGQTLPARRYLGVLDSDYVASHATTAKNELVADEAIEALKSFASERASAFIERRRAERQQTFIEVARQEASYPFKTPPITTVEKVEQGLYDQVLTLMNEVADVAGAPPAMRQMLMRLARTVMRGDDDLAEVVAEVLGLDQPQVQEFADLLRRTDIASIIRVASMVVDRLDFLRVLDDVLYGRPGLKVNERQHLQKMLEKNSWIFGEEWHLTTADQTIAAIVQAEKNRLQLDPDSDTSARIDVSPELRLVPDFYLVQNRQSRGVVEHLVVEIKAPGVRITDGHIQQLERYAEAVVEQPVFGEGHHSFTFMLLSSDIVERVERMRLQQTNQPYGLFSSPNLRHTTALHAYRWSTILDDRRADLDYLQKQVERREDPEAAAYLRSKFPELFSDDASSSSEAELSERIS